MPVLVVGSIAIDSVKTQLEERREVLGGAASYASIAASFFSPVNLVGIVGTDFPQEYVELFKSRGINLDGLEVADGRTFRWSGEYEWDMNQRKTLDLELNVFETFKPKLPEAYKQDADHSVREYQSRFAKSRSRSGRTSSVRGRGYDGSLDIYDQACAPRSSQTRRSSRIERQRSPTINVRDQFD